jgi:hypothetical protein
MLKTKLKKELLDCCGDAGSLRDRAKGWRARPECQNTRSRSCKPYVENILVRKRSYTALQPVAVETAYSR